MSKKTDARRIYAFRNISGKPAGLVRATSEAQAISIFFDLEHTCECAKQMDIVEAMTAGFKVIERAEEQPAGEQAEIPMPDNVLPTIHDSLIPTAPTVAFQPAEPEPDPVSEFERSESEFGEGVF